MPEQDAPAPIEDGDDLLRWILKKWIVTAAGGGTRLSSEAFEESSDDEDDGAVGGVSLFVAKETTPEKVFENGKTRSKLSVCSVASIPAGAPRSEGYSISRDPQDYDASHVNVIPPSVSEKELRRRRRRLVNLYKHALGDTWGPQPAAISPEQATTNPKP